MALRPFWAIGAGAAISVVNLAEVLSKLTADGDWAEVDIKAEVTLIR